MAFYFALAVLLLVGLCVFSTTFNLVACAVMAALTALLAAIRWLVELKSAFRSAGGRVAEPLGRRDATFRGVDKEQT